MPPHRVQRPPARTRKEPVHKTARRELHPLQRAFLCGALLGGASQQSLSRDLGLSQATLSRTFSRLKTRAAELGIAELALTDPRLVREAPKLFEDVNRRGRKELLTPEQRAMVVAVATRSKETQRMKSSRFVGMRRLEDGTVERTMDPELVALGLPMMSTSTFEGCMYEAGYVRTKEGWKKTGGGSGSAAKEGGGKKERKLPRAGDGQTEEEREREGEQMEEMPEESMHPDLRDMPAHDPLLDPDLQAASHPQTDLLDAQMMNDNDAVPQRAHNLTEHDGQNPQDEQAFAQEDFGQGGHGHAQLQQGHGTTYADLGF